MFAPLCSGINRKSTLAINPATTKNMDVLQAPTTARLNGGHYASLSPISVHYTMLQRTVCMRSISGINPVAMENMGNSHREATSSYCKLTPCIVSEKNWNTKEDKGKPMMRALYVLRLAKRHMSGRSNVE